MRSPVLKVLVSALVVCLANARCKPSLRNPDWRPEVSPKMAGWFNSLKYNGFSGTRPYTLDFPKWYFIAKMPDHKLTREGVELGRYLFYDKNLSSDSTVSCASCHDQRFNFSDEKQFSKGVKGRVGHRNSMQLINLIFDQRFFWDGRAPSLEAQVLMPIQDSLEMDLPLPELMARLGAHPLYPQLFERAFGARGISPQRVAEALAQFVRSIISYSSPEDYFRAYEERRLDFKDIPREIHKLWPLYLKTIRITNCGACHSVALETGQNIYDDVGLDKTPEDGYFVVTKNPQDKGKFKTPNLRNLALTAPYMHDGRFKDVRSVIEHYRSEMHIRPNISPMYLDKDGKLITEKITDAEVEILVEGFAANIDYKVLPDARYGDPFK